MRNNFGKYTFLILAIAALFGCNNGSATNSNSNSFSTQQQLTLMEKNPGLKLDIQLASIENLNSITNRNNIYVAVGDKGYILQSADGHSWHEISSELTQNFHAVVFNTFNKLFYAVGDNGVIISSPDGLTWQNYKSLLPLRDLYSIIVVNGKLIIGASNSTIFEVDTTSPRGLVTVLNTVDNMQLTSAAVNKDLMILGSNDGSILYKKIANAGTSSEWLRATKFTGSQINSILFEDLDNWFVAVTSSGEVAYSSNGISWSTLVSIGKGTTLSAIALDTANGEFLMTGASNSVATIFSSSDFNNWLTVPAPVNLKLNDLKCFSNKDCYIVGNAGIILFGQRLGSSSQRIWVSSDINIDQLAEPILKSGEVVTNQATNSDGSTYIYENLLFQNTAQGKSLILQKDGNLVCKIGSSTVWASSTGYRGSNATSVTMAISGVLNVANWYTSYQSLRYDSGAFLGYDRDSQVLGIFGSDRKALLMRLC